MLNVVDSYLNKTTMYRVVLYGLSLLVFQSIILSFFNVLQFDYIWLIASISVISIFAYVTKISLSWSFKVPTNYESSAITALILFLIIEPASDFKGLIALALIAVIAISSKFIFVWNRIHIFNPAAFAALIAGLTLNYFATWWVGSAAMLFLSLLVGLMILKKVRRFQMFFMFLVMTNVSIYVFNFNQIMNQPEFLYQIFTAWPIIFLGTVMLTEPLTMPGTHKLQLLYAALVGILFGARFNLGPFYSTPEFALLIANLVFFVLHPRAKFLMKLKDKIELAPNILEFNLEPEHKVKHAPGQYMEWTLDHNNMDDRGNRRYFTVASSPLEENIKLGVKFNEPGSSFKKALKNLNPGDEIYAAHIGGDFILDTTKPSVFIAGGIGVTPFRSMIKTLVDKGQKYKAILFYFVRSEESGAYKDLFKEAEDKIGLKVFYITSGKSTDLQSLITKEVFNYHDYQFYLSGPAGMVESYKKALADMKVDRKNIKTDYFPGF